MMSTENQSGELISASEENVVRQLGPELDSGLETPRGRMLKQRLFSESASDMKSHIEELARPRKYLKGSGSSNMILAADNGDDSQRSFGSGFHRASMINKENRNPGFLNPPRIMKEKNFRKKRRNTDNIELTPEEGLKLLEVWEKNYFIDFNSWLQCAKAKISTNITEKEHISAANPEKTYKTKSYQCVTKLFFNEIEQDAIFANGVGKSKKQARKMAIRQIITLLIQRNLISLGLKDKSFLYKDNVDKNSTKLLFRYGYGSIPKVDSSAEERERRLKKEIKRLNKRLHQSLRNDNFVEACQHFCQIISNKKPEWNEVCQIWSYALHKKEPKYAKVILDLLQFKRVKQSIVEELGQGNQAEGIKVKTLEGEEPKKVEIKNKRTDNQNFLKYLYGFQRIRNSNPYDIVDFTNFKYCEPEGVLNPEGIINFDRFDPDEGFDIALDEFGSKFDNVGIDELGQILALEDQNMEDGDNESMEKKDEDVRRGMEQFDAKPCQIKINRTTTKEFKDPNINYLDSKLLNQMYGLLMYCGDMKFAVQTSEMLYTRTQLSDQEFINPYACYYYAHRKNMLQIDFLESVYRSYMNPENNHFGFVRLEGKLQKIGYKFKQQVLTFEPQVAQEPNLDSKIVRRGFSVLKNISDIRSNSRVNENEYVMLVCLQNETEIKGDPDFNNLLNVEGGPKKGYHCETDKEISFENIKESLFFQQNISHGRKVKHMMFGFITDISRDFLIKMYCLPTEDQAIELKQSSPDCEWVLARMPVSGYHFNADTSLYEFTTRKSVNPSIAHIILSPPLTSRKYLEEIQDTRADLQIHQSLKVKNQINTILTELGQRLDGTQLQAVNNALCKSFSLVHSSSCSGKMAVIVEIVTAWLKLSTASILICAESNMKADMLHMALTKGGIYSVRLFNSPDNHENEAITEDFENTVDHLKETNSYYNAYYIRFPIIKKILSSASVVCTTLDALSGEYLRGNFFPRTIVDDTSSCFEPLVLGALTKNCQHAVLFGDHKLTPPKAASEFSVSKGLKISLFERLVMQGYPYTFLDYQYLINHVISFFPSFHFYSQNLKSGVINSSQLAPVSGFTWPNPEIGMTLIHVDKPEEHVMGTIQNTVEAEIIVKILVKFLMQGEIELSEIGILTTYYGQKRLLKQAIELAKKKYPTVFAQRDLPEDKLNVMVDLVGKEKTIDKELIMVSTVRSNKEKNVGILRDPRILNSMITKGRRGVIVVGNLRTLAKEKVWQQFIFWAQSNSIIYNYN